MNTSAKIAAHSVRRLLPASTFERQSDRPLQLAGGCIQDKRTAPMHARPHAASHQTHHRRPALHRRSGMDSAMGRVLPHRQEARHVHSTHPQERKDTEDQQQHSRAPGHARGPPPNSRAPSSTPPSWRTPTPQPNTSASCYSTPKTSCTARNRCGALHASLEELHLRQKGLDCVTA